MGCCLTKTKQITVSSSVSKTQLIDNMLALETIYKEYLALNELDKIIHYDQLSIDIGCMYTVDGQLNRHPAILPYDYNRIKLINPIQGCDYINASWITGPWDNNKLNRSEPKMSQRNPTFISFVASQAPTENTCAHHLQMIMDYSIDIVVVLTPLQLLLDNGSVERCHQYWPDEINSSKLFGNIKVTTLKEEKLRKQTFKRNFKLENTNRHVTSSEKSFPDSCHLVTQFHFTGWPDCSIPEDCELLIPQQDPILNLIRDVKKDINTNKNEVRILVHCAVGVGRTGTFIALFQLDEDLKLKNVARYYDKKCLICSEITSEHDEIIPGLSDTRRMNMKLSGGLDIFTTVLKLRCKRMRMVETEEQYQYLYMAAEMEAKRKSRNKFKKP